MSDVKRPRAGALWAGVLVLAAAAASGEPAAVEVGECGPGPGSVAEDALFRFAGVDYGEADLSPAMQQTLYAVRLEHYERQQRLFDAAVIDMEIARIAAESGRTGEAVARELLQVPPVSDAAITAFYDANQARIPYPLASVKDRIGEMIAEQSLERQRLAVIERVKAARGFERLAPRPLAPYAEIALEGLPSKGPADAPVTIVEFADYQCPHCRTAAAVLAELASSYPDAVRVVFVDFPVNQSGISRRVAEGAACADRQGRFWAFHDLAFETQDQLGPDSSVQLAAALGLDLEAFRACLASPFPAERVVRSEAEGRRLGVSATPTIFVNGRRSHVHDLATELPALIEAERVAAGS